MIQRSALLLALLLTNRFDHRLGVAGEVILLVDDLAAPIQDRDQVGMGELP